MSGLAVVLGGGGSAGVAWEIGVLHGLAEGGADVRLRRTCSSAPRPGRSWRSGCCRAPDSARLFEAVCRPVGAVPMDLDYARRAGRLGRGRSVGATSAADARRRIGDLARAAETMTPETRRAEIAALLPSSEWPERPLVVTAVNAADGEAAWFDRDSEVPLLDAVSASSCGARRLAAGRGARRRPTSTGRCAPRPTPTWPPVTTGCWCWPRWPPIGGVARELGRLA